MTDLEIAKKVKLKKIVKIAKKLNYNKNDLIMYGNSFAKMNLQFGKKKGKVILVTAMNPTSAGIGKTTVSIGLADALQKLGKSVCLALREPSLGPVFGVKGGATGGGQSQVAPMEEINLHFTGDFHAITSANNLLCSMIDNHIYHGNQLQIDKDRVVFSRCLDINDRALRNITVSCGKNGEQRNDSFVITAASEVMAILCLSTNFDDLKKRLGKILVAYNLSGNPVYASDLKAQDAMAILLKDAFKPNLVQSLNHTPCIMHLGPFANISHGCNSVIATKMAMSYSDYVVTEAGFGSDLGAEKFFDIKCRVADINPSCVVLIATLQSIKLHGGADKNSLKEKNIDAVIKGLDNLYKHIDNISNVYNLPLVVTLNHYQSDILEEMAVVKKELQSKNIKLVYNDVYSDGKNGALDLAKQVLNACDKQSKLNYCYELSDCVDVKIQKICTQIYGAQGVEFSEEAKLELQNIKKFGYDNLPVVMAKTQYSLSDNPKLINNPTDFVIHIDNLQIKSGAGYIVAIAGNMLLMPGLSKIPNAVKMEIDSNLNIKGLF